ncbi:MAG: hypothetical protein AB7S38_43040 [Vulcanimicrobiota bacterium]
MRFDLASPNDEARLRELAASVAVPGWVRVSYRREPDFFAAGAVLGDPHQVLVARDPQGRPVGCASRSVRPLWMAGEPRAVGYLSGLRVSPQQSGRAITPRGFAFLRELHQDGLCQSYLTTIIEDNQRARRLLESRPRPSMPAYRAVARLRTRAIPLTRRRHRSLGWARPEHEQQLLAFLRRQGAKRNGFPVIERLGRGMPEVGDFCLAFEGARLVGAAALWDQRAYKQTVVEGYASSLARLRHVVNGLAGNRLLPAVGEQLAMACLACWLAPDRQVLAQLVETVAAEARRRGLAYLMVAGLASDPLSGAFDRFYGFDYTSLVFRVDLGKEVEDERLDYLELGTL